MIDLWGWVWGVAMVVNLTLLGLLRIGWNKASTQSMPSLKQDLPPLSVLIAARNEAANLSRFLPSILDQSYTEFEVLIILNQTEDESKAVLSRLKESYPALHWIEVDPIPEHWSPKKWALEQGVKAAQYDNLVLTDADCRAEGNWLQGIGHRFAMGYEVILGLGGYEPSPGWLGTFIQYETQYTALQYIGSAYWGYPYMAVGRNLAYAKDFFTKNGGLLRWQDKLSGDDDLLIEAYASTVNTTAMLEPGTRTWSQPPKSWKDWWNQKTRHVSSSNSYSLTIKVLLGIFHLSHLLIYLGLIVGIVAQATAWVALGLYVSYVLLKAWALSVPNRLHEVRPLLHQQLGLDLSYFLYNLSVVPLGLIKRPKWKSRIPEYPKTPKKTGN